MRALTMLRGALEERLDFLHAKTRAALWRGVAGVMQGGQLWLTGLGRGLPGNTSDKHRIKAADRLLGSANLHSSILATCRVLAHFLVGELRQPCISIDWTGAGPRHYLLSASLSFCGRALPILSRIYPASQKNSPKAAREFLDQLKLIIPAGSTPVLITDAAFYHEWFDDVGSHGWDFIGRLRGAVHVRVDGRWCPLRALHRMSGRNPRCLGVVPTNRKQPRELRVVLSGRRKSKGRKSLTLKGTPRRNTNSKRASISAREPWVLATSINCSPAAVVAIYARRMQIEECFRDLKSHRYGWSLDHVRCKTPERIELLLLLAALAMVAMHIIGLGAERARMHFGYQANTIRTRRAFSTFFLARLALRHGHAALLKPEELRWGLASLHAQLRQASVTH